MKRSLSPDMFVRDRLEVGGVQNRAIDSWSEAPSRRAGPMLSKDCENRYVSNEAKAWDGSSSIQPAAEQSFLEREMRRYGGADDAWELRLAVRGR